MLDKIIYMSLWCINCLPQPNKINEDNRAIIFTGAIDTAPYYHFCFTVQGVIESAYGTLIVSKSTLYILDIVMPLLCILFSVTVLTHF